MAKRAKQKQYRENAKQRKKDAKEAAVKEKKGVMVASGSRKEKWQAKVTDDERSDTDMPVSKRKQSSPDSMDRDVVDITAYIHVLRPSPPSAAPKNWTRKPEDDYVQKGPFKFQSNDSYDAFLTNIAVALPCPSPDYIVTAKMTWKPQKPLKAPSFPLGSELGFSIMVEQVAAKKGDGRVIILTMPDPMKPVEEQPVCLLFIFLCPHWWYLLQFWATDDTIAPAQDFNYEELQLQSTQDHVQQQCVRHLYCGIFFSLWLLLSQITFDQAIGPKRLELEEKYPVDNNPLFPGKHIYTDPKTGFHWELTSGRLNVWAAHLVCFWLFQTFISPTLTFL